MVREGSREEVTAEGALKDKKELGRMWSAFQVKGTTCTKAQRSEKAWLGGVSSGTEVQSAKTSCGQSAGCGWGRGLC